MFSSRNAFLLGTLLAIVGSADAAATSCNGAASTYNTITNPDAAAAATAGTACTCVTGYAAANNDLVGTTALDCVKCVAGYYLSTATGVAAAGVCTIAPANTYHPGLGLISASSVETPTACPFGGTVAATGTTVITDCMAADVGSALHKNAGTVRCAAKYYGTPTDTHNQALLVAAKGCTICPFDGVSTAGSNAVTNCDAPNPGTGYTDSAGTTVCATDYYGAPKDAAGAGLAVASQGCTACPFGGASTAGSNADITTFDAADPGTAGYADSAGTTVCAADFYGTPTSSSPGVADGGCTACPTNSESTAGTTTLAGCTVTAGFYIATKATSATIVGPLAISATLADFYSVGGASASEQNDALVMATATACPYGGTVGGTGSDELSDCTSPACGSVADASSGTCVCKTNYAGTVLSPVIAS
jgi:hypothetical protein